MAVKKEKRRKTDRNRQLAVDRISDLPDWIIHDHIMSRLSRRDRARTKVLSKTWYHLNKTYPALDFDFECFFLKEKSDFRLDTPEYLKSLKTFTERAGKSLRRFRRKKLRLHSLRVKHSLHSYPKFESDIDKWIGLGLESRMEKLKLYCPYYKREYTLLQSVYFSTTLTTLKLDICVLDQPLSVFSSLRKLTLSQCRLNNGPLVLKHSDCPALESLNISCCVGMDSVRISNLVQLSRVEIEFVDPLAVKIASQRVQKLSIVDFSEQDWSEISIDGCDRLKSLYLNSETIIDEELHSLLSKFPLLEELCVYGCQQLKAMQVSSPLLRTLVVVPRSHESPLMSIGIEVPTLKNFMFLPYNPRIQRTKIKGQSCCFGSLETLVLCSPDMRDKDFHELITKFPQLRSLWIFGCDGLQTIAIPNPQLRRLHISRCSELKAVEVSGGKLFDMYCAGREDLEISVPDLARMYSIGSLKRDTVDCKIPFWSDSLHEMLRSIVIEKSLADVIGRDCCGF